MFTQITLKNYRTHKSTTITLGPVTLLIGNNNSGKTNLLTGIQHFASLIRRTNPKLDDNPIVRSEDYFPNRYRLASDDDVMSISMKWENPAGKIIYQMELYKPKDTDTIKVGCREKMDCQPLSVNVKTIHHGFDRVSNLIGLRQKVETDRTLNEEEKQLCRSFFWDFAYTFSYHLQPSFLKGLVEDHALQSLLNQSDKTKSEEQSLSIPAQLGYQGEHLQELILYAKEKEEPTFARFTALLRRFIVFFNGVRANAHSKTLWEFDLGQENRRLDEFPPILISDGILKAAALALLASLEHPPALLLLEEIENGINPGNLEILMHWLWQATTNTTQFILTSHSPSVLRTFHKRLNHVYVVRLERRNFRSQVTNLNEALKTLIDIGTIDEEAHLVEKDGEQLIEIPKYRLTELWYSGTIG